MFKKGENSGKQKGFSLIELMVVIVIISILAAIAIPAYLGAREKAKKSNIIKATESARSDLQHWLHSALKGTLPGSVNGALIEVDTNWDGNINSSDMSNATLFAVGANAADSVINQYVQARTGGSGMNGVELSPWAGMGSLSSSTVLFTSATDPGNCNTVGPAGQAGLSSPSTTTIRITANSNGPGGRNTSDAELLKCMIVVSE